MIQILCRRKSTGARDLARTINVLAGVVCAERSATPKAGAFGVNWGESVGAGLNARAGRSKLTEIITLGEKNVPCLTVSRGKPKDLDGWLGRESSHHEGNDLLRPRPEKAAFWTRYENLTQEFRVHIFKRGDEFTSIRLGAKFPRVKSPHLWVRSWQAGWALRYGKEAAGLLAQFKRAGVRDVARAAVEALGLDFGAVDVGIVARTGKAIVLEVNTAPGLEGETLNTYAKEIMRHAGVKVVGGVAS